MSLLDRIAIDPAVAHGRPTVRGTRMRVSDVLALIDAQLPPALARLLREHGHEADHVTDIGPGDTPDHDLWRFALANESVIVTKDEAFSNMIARGGEAPAVVWVRAGNTRRAVLQRGSSRSSTRSYP